MIPVLIESALRALVVAAVVWAGLRVFRVTNVLAQKAAWGLVLLAALAMPQLMRWQFLPAGPVLRLPVPAWRQAANAQTAAGETNSDFTPIFARPLDTAALPIRSITVPPESYPAVQTSSIQTPPPVSRMRSEPGETRMAAPSVAALAWMLYLAVAAVFLFRLVYGLALAVDLWCTAQPVDLGSGFRARVSDRIASPVTIGSGVVLPEDFAQWTPEKLRIVLAHERSHIRQGDFYLQLLAGVHAALFWFSPLGWYLKRRLSDLAETISDRAGLEEAASRSSYAGILLEFAALPRPTLTGVAMARPSSLSHRIERLLNDSSFRQAFAGSRRRMLIALLLVPVALFAGTALIRVEAAAAHPAGQQGGQQAPQPAAAPGPATTPEPAAAPAPLTGQSNPEQVTDTAPPPPQSPDAAPAPAAPPVPPVSGVLVVPDNMTPVPPLPPAPGVHVEVNADVQDDMVTNTHTYVHNNRIYAYNKSVQAAGASSGDGYHYSWSSHGDTYALVTDPSQHITFSGDGNDNTRADLDKVRKRTSGKFLWFTHDGKSWFIDDPAIIAHIQAMYRPMEELGKQQEALGKQQEVLGKQQEALGRRQEQASVPTPDISKEMAELNAAVAKLQAKKGSTVSQEEIADIEGKIGDIQGRLGDLQGRIGEQQGRLGDEQGRLGEQQGRLGEQQGRLGEQQGRLAEQADREVKSIIEQSLHNGKAHPVQ